MEARRAHNPEVVGSSPASATKELLKSKDFGSSSFCEKYLHGQNMRGDRMMPEKRSEQEPLNICLTAKKEGGYNAVCFLRLLSAKADLRRQNG